MNLDLRLPFITAKDPQGKMEQMQSYMYQLVEQLNYALQTVDAETTRVIEEAKSSASGTDSQQEAIDTFISIKELIIKSADIIKAYEEAMEVDFSGMYVAQSDYGTFTEETSQAISANSSSITQLLQNISTIETTIAGIQERVINAYLRSGELDDGVYGVEVGQTTTVSGTEVFNKFARFTAGGIYLYNAGQTDPVAWLSDKKLYITDAQITSSLVVGGFRLESSTGLAFRWVGYNG